MCSIVAAFSVDTRDMDLAASEQSPSDFRYVLKNSFNLDKAKQYDIALIRGLMYYAWDNLIAGIVPFDFSFNGTVCTLPTGNYSILTLEAKIREQIVLFGAGDPLDFEMRKDYPTGLIYITLLNAATFEPISDGLAQMIGFPAGVVIGGGGAYSSDKPDFEGKNSRIFILNSIVLADNTFVNQKMDNYLYEVKAPERPAYSQFNIVDTPEGYLWFPINTHNVFNMDIRVINQDHQTVDLNGTNIKLWMVIRERPHNTVRVEGQNSGDSNPRY